MGGIPSLKLGGIGDDNKGGLGIGGMKPKMGFGLDLSKAKQINEEHLAN
jgi:hypothetical protein